MNKAALANFLRHLLFLFVILKFISGVIISVASPACYSNFANAVLLPPDLDSKLFKSIYIFMSFMFAFFTSVGYLIIIISLVGFVGAVYLQSHQLINFAAGTAFLLLAPLELTMTRVGDNLVETLDILIDQKLDHLFSSSNVYDAYADRWDSQEHMKLFLAPYRKGWNVKVLGGETNHTYVDFVQLISQCCGLSGRFFWEVSIPMSCCSEENRGDKCTTMTAHTKSCLYDYSRFKGCVISLEYESCFFCILSVVTAIISLYLARLRMKFPDGNYASEHSSEEEEDTSFFR